MQENEQGGSPQYPVLSLPVVLNASYLVVGTLNVGLLASLSTDNHISHKRKKKIQNLPTGVELNDLLITISRKQVFGRS